MNEHPTNEEIQFYLDRRFGQEDPILHTVRQHSLDQRLPSIQIPIYLGRYLYLLAKIQKAKRLLEIGCLGGYSTSWLAKALPDDGKLISIELNPSYVAIAKEHLEWSHLTHQVDIVQGSAIEVLTKMKLDDTPAFDFIFIDADKENNVLYLEWAIELSRSGTLIIIDNLIPRGHLIGVPDNKQADEVYRFNDYLANHSRVETAAIPTLRNEGGRLDCLALAYVK